MPRLEATSPRTPFRPAWRRREPASPRAQPAASRSLGAPLNVLLAALAALLARRHSRLELGQRLLRNLPDLGIVVSLGDREQVGLRLLSTDRPQREQDLAQETGILAA